jgi:hypothetical protein
LGVCHIEDVVITKQVGKGKKVGRDTYSLPICKLAYLPTYYAGICGSSVSATSILD